MKLKYYTFLIVLFYGISGISQEMKKGFAYLDTEKYQEAEIFFKRILEKYPTNKTAKLCYGRAVGLNGNPEEATTLLSRLLGDFPNDFEVKLNYAESLLWSQQYTSAERYYEKLVRKDSLSFPALLGYANTLSNLQKFDNAIIYVDKALAVIPGNQNALISKKHIRLGLANNQLKAQKYIESENILKENFTDFKNDKETLLNLANLYLNSNQIDKAKKTYEIIGENPADRITSLNGISLAYHLDTNNKQALLNSEKAKKLLDTNTATAIREQTTERYIQALIWNKKYKAANKEIATLLESNKNPENWILSLRATLNIYKSDFKKSITDYNLILKKDSTSFDGNLGKAYALKASGYYNNAYKSAEKTLKFYENQKDAANFIKNLDTNFTPFVRANTAYSFDVDNNEAYSYSVTTEFPFTTRFRVLAGYNYRTTSNSMNKGSAYSNTFLAGISYQIFNNVTFKGITGVGVSKTENNDFSQLLMDLSFNIKPYKLQTLEVGYKRDVENFNAELLDREIVQNIFLINYSVNTNFKLGWFTQYYFTSQNDDNTSNLLFTSLYNTILDKPFLKAGFNYQNISFKNQVPTIYFSPSKFNAVEIFFNLIKEESSTKNKEWFYEITAASGTQFIEDEKKQSTYRVQGKLGYKFSSRSFLNIYGTKSNISSTTAAGFTYTEIGVLFKYYIFSKPLYKK